MKCLYKKQAADSLAIINPVVEALGVSEDLETACQELEELVNLGIVYPEEKEKALEKIEDRKDEIAEQAEAVERIEVPAEAPVETQQQIQEEQTEQLAELETKDNFLTDLQNAFQ